jgi:RNA polymerase sigma factor (sigma-70 family)
MKAPLLFMDEDARILDGIRTGDETALVILYRTNRKSITAFLLRNNGTADDAEDMLQEALIILWERIRTGRHEYNAKLSTFLFGTVRNLWLRRLARKRRESPATHPPEEFPDETLSPLDQIIDDEQTKAVRSALEALGEPCRTLLLLFYWEELSMDDIARRLGFANADTAKSKKYQCKKSLKDLLNNRSPELERG